MQDEIYYYPLLDANDKVLFVMSVMGTTHGWKCSISEELVECLNMVGNITQDSIVYLKDKKLYIETEHEKYDLSDKTDINKFRSNTNEDYSQIKETISHSTNRFVKTDIDQIYKMSNKDMKAPGFSVNTQTEKKCSLYNPQGQYDTELCWAACIATIYNYRKEKNKTAENVANTAGMYAPYFGQDNYQVQSILNNYFEIDYPRVEEVATNKMSLSDLKTNINNKYPVYVNANCYAGEGHSVLAYGWRSQSVKDFITCWNPAQDSNTGGSFTTYFSGTDNITFSHNNMTYSWVGSVSKY